MPNSFALFQIAKVGAFLDAIRHHNETRPGGEVKVITVSLRVDPFDAKLATAMSDIVRRSLFSLNAGDPLPHLRRVDFALGIKRQQIACFASSDTAKASIALDQAKISRIYARTSKDANGFVLVFDATFGPVGKSELEYVEGWRGTQRALTFREAEPSMEFGDGDEAEEGDELKTAAPTPMFDDPRDGDAAETIAENGPSGRADAGDDTAAEPARHLPRRNPRTSKPNGAATH